MPHHGDHGDHHVPGDRVTALDASKMYPLLGPHPTALLNVLFVLLTVGQACLTILLATILFSRQVRKRNATMVNLLLVTIASTIPPPLLYYGQQILNPFPPYGLCLAQAVLKHGSDPMFCVAALALILEILLETGLIVTPLTRKARVRSLVALPYVVFFLFALWTLALGQSDQHAVQHQKNDYYCSITYSSFGHGINIFSLIVEVVTIAVEIYGVFKARAIWRDAPKMRPINVFSKGLYLRIMGFTCCQMFLFVLFALDFYFGSVATHVIPIAFEATMPLLTFLIFASCPDCLAAWMCWRKRDQPAVRRNTLEAVQDLQPEVDTVQRNATPASLTFLIDGQPRYLDIEIPDGSLNISLETQHDHAP